MILQRNIAGRLILSLVVVLGLLLSGALVLRAAVPLSADAPPPPVADAAQVAPTVPGELVLAVPAGFDRAALDALARRHGARVERWAPRLGLALLSTPVGREQQAIRDLEAEPAVRFATEQRLLARIADIPLDEYWDRQWGMAQVQGPAAWDVTWSDPSVVIAVIDTGVHLQHWDLRDRLWYNPGESALDPLTGLPTCNTPLASNQVDDDGNGYVDDCIGYDFVTDDHDPMDEHGHGTFVAGITGAATNNLDPYLGTPEGVAGMARQARLMALRALNARGEGSAFGIAQAIDYAAANGARIINLSLTYPPATSPYSPDVEMLRLAVEAAQAADVLVVAASGNDYYNGVSFPAKFPGVLAVGASRRDDTRAGFSNYGARLDLVAPGVEIFSTLLRSGTHNYGYYGGSISKSAGTSFASPHVAGAAALVRSLRPDLGQADVYELVRRTADDAGDPGWDTQTGWGRLNAAQAVAEAAIGLRLGLAAEPAAVAVGGQAALRLAITAPAGAAAGLGARVAFSATGGVISPTVVTADGTGQATTWFTASQITGTAHITATLAGVTATLPVAVTSGQPATLTLTATPAVIGSGGDQATITASVRDEGGSVVFDGTPVTFTTTLGSLEPATAFTVGGQATSALTSGVFSGMAVVQAAAGGFTATVPVAILGAGEPYTVTLAAEPPQIALDGAPAVITATVTDALGDLVPDGVAVTFVTDLGILSAAEALTTNGRAVTQLDPGAVVGTAHITATAGSAVGSLPVSILPGPAATVTVTADPTELVADFNQISHLAATARDRYGNPVVDGAVLHFATSLGQLIPASAPTTAGVARVLLLGGQVAGAAAVTVTAPGGAEGTLAVRIRPSAPAALALAAAPEQIAVGGEVGLVRATVRDAFGNLAADGTAVTFTTNLGTLRAADDPGALTGTLFVTGTVAGIAEAALVSGPATGTAEVRAAISPEVMQARSVRIVPGPAARLTLGVFPERMRAGGRVELSAWVVDRYENNVADGTIVSFAADGGQLDQVTAPTENGVALTWLTLPAQVGSVQVAALSGAAADFKMVTVLHGSFLPLILH